MARISISRAFEEANALLRREAALLVPVALALIALPAVVSDMVGPTLTPAAATPATQGLTVGALVGPLGLLLTLLASLVVSVLALRPGTSVGEAFGVGFRRLGVAVGSSLLAGLCVVLLVAPALPLMLGGEAAVRRLNPAFSLLLAIYLLAATAAVLFLMVRLLLLNTVVAAERLGAFASIARAWELTRGLFWRLSGFVLVFLIASVVVSFAVVAAGGSVGLLIGRLLGDPALGRLLVSLLLGVANALFLTWLYVMLACLYRQVAGVAGSSSGI